MKKFILITLFALPFCKAADPQTSSRAGRVSNKYDAWDRAVERAIISEGERDCFLSLRNKGIQFINPTTHEKLSKVTVLTLKRNNIEEIPKEFSLKNLKTLCLDENPIESLDVDSFLKQFPALDFLTVESTPLTKEHNCSTLKKLQKKRPNLCIAPGKAIYPDLPKK